ncbi:MAG: hypothetical protein IJS60_02875 [Abditibacteriota bacterium]|nr:hypothetical protein [Abditibacteriota bacterium]
MENFIWTELLAFDNTQKDMGVDAYLERIGYTPYGISLLLSHPDFVFLHKGMDEDYNLFRDICSRQGHPGNEERARQQWTSFELKSLVQCLQKKGIKVFCSVFATHTFDKYHTEWASCDDNALIVYNSIGITPGMQLISRLKDGTYTEDVFVSQLERVMVDYGFDGYHGPDCMGPGGALSVTDYSDNMIAQFCMWVGYTPNELKEPLYDPSFEFKYDVEKLKERSDYIWQNLRKEWVDFYCYRWKVCWEKIIKVLKKHNKLSMINSANTKADFEAKYIYGIDYRDIAELGLDYILVECVAANCGIIYGGHDYHFDFLTTLADTKAMMPNTKVIYLHGVKDVVESYDLLRHAPSRLEREFFSLSNFYYTEKAGEYSRCADGFMVCLGDGIKSYEWDFLRSVWQLGYEFSPNKLSDFTWVWCDDTMEGLMDEFPKYGTWPGFKQVSKLLTDYDIQISSVARVENVPNLKENLIVPNAHLYSQKNLDILKEYKGGVVALFGDFSEGYENSEQVCQRVGDYNLSCVILNGNNICTSLPSVSNEFKDIPSPIYFWFMAEYMTITEDFWNKVAELLKKYKTSPVLVDDYCVNIYGDRVKQDDLRVITLENDEYIRLALINTKDHYIESKLSFTEIPTKVEKKSGFPYTSVTVNEKGEFKCGSGQTPLHIPPYGIIVLDYKK